MFTERELIYIKESLSDELRALHSWFKKYDYNNPNKEKLFKEYENLIEKIENLLDKQ